MRCGKWDEGWVTRGLRRVGGGGFGDDSAGSSDGLARVGGPRCVRSPTASVLGIGRDRMDPRTVTDETVTAANQVAPRFTFFFLWPAGIRKRKKNIEFSQKVRSAWIISCRIRRQGSCSSTVIASLHCPAKQFNMIEKQR
ncbi:unnamed protein product [Musa acuminata subsp. burmannicoides]